ncbi:MAG TPA: histidine phosphatase family protein [Candidatus Acidoferrum sp.]|nr:histidine phosphatase family protein [Candidatus Acidoferrum sp.]
MRAIVLCRHGVTESNIAGRFLSRTDVPLSPLGVAQCRQLQIELEAFDFERCLVSPMRRCLETREIVAPHTPFEIDTALREIDFGTWEGETLEWLQANDPSGLAQRRRDPVHFRPPQGENFADVAQRLRPVVETLRSPLRWLVVAHRGTLGVLERLLRDLPLESQAVKGLEPAQFRVVP